MKSIVKNLTYLLKLATTDKENNVKNPGRNEFSILYLKFFKSLLKNLTSVNENCLIHVLLFLKF